MTDTTFALFGPLATAIRDLLFSEWDPCHINDKPAFIDAYDDYIPAIHRLVRDRHSTIDAEEIEDIAAYLGFVVKNHLGGTPDRELNHQVAAKLFALVEATRRNPSMLVEVMTAISINSRIPETVD